MLLEKLDRARFGSASARVVRSTSLLRTPSEAPGLGELLAGPPEIRNIDVTGFGGAEGHRTEHNHQSFQSLRSSTSLNVAQ